jgi:hypothetical protein
MQGLAFNSSDFAVEVLAVKTNCECPPEYLKTLVLLGCGHPTFAIKDVAVLKACQDIRYNIVQAAMSLGSAQMAHGFAVLAWNHVTHPNRFVVAPNSRHHRMGLFRFPRMKPL